MFMQYLLPKDLTALPTVYKTFEVPTELQLYMAAPPLTLTVKILLPGISFPAQSMKNSNRN